MSISRQRVYVLLADFTGDLWEISRIAHVWIVDSEKNKPAIAAVWAKDKSYSETYGVTCFKPANNILEKLYELLISIDEHHAGDGMHALPWEELLIQSVDIQEIDTEEIKEILATNVTLTMENGFILVRKTSYFTE